MINQDFRPRRRPDIRTEPVGGELVLYDAAGGRAGYLNSTAAAIWALCDGERSVAQIATYLAREIGGEHVASDVTATIDRFKSNGILT